MATMYQSTMKGSDDASTSLRLQPLALNNSNNYFGVMTLEEHTFSQKSLTSPHFSAVDSPEKRVEVEIDRDPQLKQPEAYDVEP